jgi:hypothetical protein
MLTADRALPLDSADWPPTEGKLRNPHNASQIERSMTGET